MEQGRNQESNQKFLELNELSENITQQKLWDTLKAVLSGECIVLRDYIKRSEIAQVNDSEMQPRTWKIKSTSTTLQQTERNNKNQKLMKYKQLQKKKKAKPKNWWV